MTPIFLNSSSTTYSPYPNDFHHEDHLSNQYLSPNPQASSSLNSFTTNVFLNSTVYDQNRIFDTELHSPQHQHEGDILGSQAYNHQTENIEEKGVQLFTWNKGSEIINNMNNDPNQVKWVSSKMRVMLKLKKPDQPVNLNTYTSTIEETNLEQHKLPTSPVEETDNSSNSTSSNNNIPIRVCSDCYTTKTPLWRSGPRGPKSLCNACGIRQRKARRALAAAAAAENGNSDVSIIMAPLKVKKTQHKDHKKPSNGYVAKYKKRKYSKHINTPPSSPSPSPSPSPSASPCSSSSPRKNCVEEFLVTLSKNLSFYRVFPQDEKEAAILLMALSCGYAHET